jgi:hypothetical protein
VISLFIYHSLSEKQPNLKLIASQYNDTVALITEGLLKIDKSMKNYFIAGRKFQEFSA